MTEKTPAKENTAVHAVRDWLHSPKSICALMIFGAFLIVIAVFFCVCTPKKYDLRVGSISHETIDATKDIVDEVTTEEKRNAAAETVEPTYHFQDRKSVV